MEKTGGEKKPVRSTLNINEVEIDLLKSIFTGNESLLKTIRASFFGLPLTSDETALIKNTFQSEPLLAIFKRRFLPEFDKNSPLGQVQDVWLGAEKMVFGQPKDAIYQAVQYKEISIEMTRKGLALLTDAEGEKVDLTYTAGKYPEDSLAIMLLARNQYIQHVEQQLMMIWLIVSQSAAQPAVSTQPVGQGAAPKRGKGSK